MRISSVILTAHKKSSFQAKTIVFSPFYSQKHKDTFKRKIFLGVMGTLRKFKEGLKGEKKGMEHLQTVARPHNGSLQVGGQLFGVHLLIFNFKF